MSETVYIINRGDKTINAVNEIKPGLGVFHFPVNVRVEIGPEIRETRIGTYVHKTVVQTARQVAESIIRDTGLDNLKLVLVDENDILVGTRETLNDVRDAVREVGGDVNRVMSDITGMFAVGEREEETIKEKDAFKKTEKDIASVVAAGKNIKSPEDVKRAVEDPAQNLVHGQIPKSVDDLKAAEDLRKIEDLKRQQDASGMFGNYVSPALVTPSLATDANIHASFIPSTANVNIPTSFPLSNEDVKKIEDLKRQQGVNNPAGPVTDANITSSFPISNEDAKKIEEAKKGKK